MRSRRRERGSAQVMVAVAIVALIGFGALAIDTGYLMSTRTQLQTAADAAAHAAMVDMRSGRSRSQVATRARATANDNYRSVAEIEVTRAEDVEFGSWDHPTRSFRPGGGGGATAVRVTARRETPLFLASVVGLSSSQVEAQAVASLGQRRLMLVQDVTYSFNDEIDEARAALDLFARAMSGQSLSGDHLGLVTFDEAASREQPLTQLPEGLPDVLNAIERFEHCAHTSYPNCAGTDIAPGLHAALDDFVGAPDYVERVVVLVSDGVPCLPNDEDETMRRRDGALEAARRAQDEGVNTYTVFLDKPIGGSIYCWGVSNDAADPDLMQQLVTGTGRYYETPDENDLDDILLSILREMPMRIVQ